MDCNEVRPHSSIGQRPHEIFFIFAGVANKDIPLVAQLLRFMVGHHAAAA